MKWIRSKAHNWGVEKLQTIMEKDRNLRQELKNKQALLKEKSAMAKDICLEKKESIKRKIIKT